MNIFKIGDEVEVIYTAWEGKGIIERINDDIYFILMSTGRMEGTNGGFKIDSLKPKKIDNWRDIIK